MAQASAAAAADATAGQAGSLSPAALAAANPLPSPRAVCVGVLASQIVVDTYDGDEDDCPVWTKLPSVALTSQATLNAYWTALVAAAEAPEAATNTAGTNGLLQLCSHLVATVGSGPLLDAALSGLFATLNSLQGPSHILNLMVFMEEALASDQEGDSSSPEDPPHVQRMDLMERSSSMGVFVRKLVLGVTVADFWGACSLLEGLQALAAALYRSLGGVYRTNPQAIEHATGWGTHTGPPLPPAADSHDVDMAGVEASTATATVARDPLAAADAALASQPQYTTLAQLRAAVQRQLEELDEAKLATTPRHELDATAKALLHLAPASPAAHELLGATAGHVGEVNTALHHLHAHADLGMATSFPATAASPLAGTQFAVLRLAFLHAALGHTQQAKAALHGAVRAAQVQGDPRAAVVAQALEARLVEADSGSAATGGSALHPGTRHEQQVKHLLQAIHSRAGAMHMWRLQALAAIGLQQPRAATVDLPLRDWLSMDPHTSSTGLGPRLGSAPAPGSHASSGASSVPLADTGERGAAAALSLPATQAAALASMAALVRAEAASRVGHGVLATSTRPQGHRHQPLRALDSLLVAGGGGVRQWLSDVVSTAAQAQLQANTPRGVDVAREVTLKWLTLASVSDKPVLSRQLLQQATSLSLARGWASSRRPMAAASHAADAILAAASHHASCGNLDTAINSLLWLCRVAAPRPPLFVHQVQAHLSIVRCLLWPSPSSMLLHSTHVSGAATAAATLPHLLRALALCSGATRRGHAEQQRLEATGMLALLLTVLGHARQALHHLHPSTLHSSQQPGTSLQASSVLCAAAARTHLALARELHLDAATCQRRDLRRWRHHVVTSVAWLRRCEAAFGALGERQAASTAASMQAQALNALVEQHRAFGARLGGRGGEQRRAGAVVQQWQQARNEAAGRWLQLSQVKGGCGDGGGPCSKVVLPSVRELLSGKGRQWCWDCGVSK